MHERAHTQTRDSPLIDCTSGIATHMQHTHSFMHSFIHREAEQRTTGTKNGLTEKKRDLLFPFFLFHFVFTFLFAVLVIVSFVRGTVVFIDVKSAGKVVVLVVVVVVVGEQH